jgi:hypothetical protein
MCEQFGNFQQPQSFANVNESVDALMSRWWWLGPNPTPYDLEFGTNSQAYLTTNEVPVHPSLSAIDESMLYGIHLAAK